MNKRVPVRPAREVRKIEKHVFEPEYAISKNLIDLGRKELCELVAEIARQIKAESGNKAYHGGVYPENISRNPDGVIAIGPGKKSDWGEQELPYIAPEIYWNNKSSPQSDVYALGLILYYGASAGKFPFEGESGNAQLMRMSGKTVYAPAAAGKHLGDIIEKALRFKEGDRYRNPEEMAIMLDYCEDNRLLHHKSGAEAIFQKNEEELSDLEQIMLKIIDGEADAELAAEKEAGEDDYLDEIVASVRSEGDNSVQTEDEMFSQAGLVRPEKKEKPEEKDNSLAEIFGLDEPDPVDPAELEMEEEIRVYEPGSSKKGIPILTEDQDPELAPITVNSKGGKKAPAKPNKVTQTQTEEETVQKKRPFLVVLLLLAVLLIAAVVANILINAFSANQDDRGASNVTIVVPTLDPQATTEVDISAIMSEQQLQQQAEQQAQLEAQQQAEQQAQQEAQQTEQAQAELGLADPNAPHTYEVIKADVGWLEAQQAAHDRGGFLAVINTEDELNQIIALAEEAGIDRVWIGAHREDGGIVWESGENITFYPWDDGEPSYTDSGDGAAEDYILLWRHGGKWVYNDSRENPLTDFYGMYGGHIGYAVEKVG